MKKYAVVTFLFNHYDLLREPIMVDEKVDYYCLTDDKNLKSDVWQIMYLEEMDTDKLTGVQKTYMTKYSFYEYIPTHYEYFICIDASIEIKNNISKILDYYNINNIDVGFAVHPFRNRYVDEYNEWVRTRGLNKNYFNIFESYCSDNDISSSEFSGLIECTVKIFKNTEQIIGLIKNVYNTLLKYCNFADANDQCYFTNEFRKYDDKLNAGFFYRQLLAGSKYFNKYYHNTHSFNHGSNDKNRTNKIIFGKERKILEF